MSEPDRDPPVRGPLLEEAAAWFARMRAPDAESSRGAFEAWLGGGAPNRSAYNRVAEIFAMGKLLSDEPAPSPERLRSARRVHLPGVVAMTAAALLAFAIGSWIQLRPTAGERIAAAGDDRGTGAAQLATAAGERRSFRLADGSLLILAGDTRIAANFSGTLRRLTLERGQARFRVAHEARPFMVYAGGGLVTARGTLFDVALAADRRVSVRLIEGVVDVRLPVLDRDGRSAPRQRRLHAGETIGFPAAAGTDDRPAPAAAAQAQEYDHVSIAELVALANRTSTRPIRIADASLGERRISGRFRIDDTELLAQRIAALFDLSADRAGAGAILLRRKGSG